MSLSDGVAVGTITNDDAATITIGDASGAEGTTSNGSVSFPVTLATTAAAAVTIDYATSVATGQTATSGTDFTAVSTGTLTIAAGTTSGTITITTLADAEAEPDETFTVTLTTPTGGFPTGVSLSDGVAVGTITNDDADNADAITITIGDASGVEGVDLTFPVTLSAAVQDGFTVLVSFEDDTASGASGGTNADYDNATQTLSFQGRAGETQTLTVPTTDDAVWEESEETFTVTLTVSGTTLPLTTTTAVGRILDNDANDDGTVTFSSTAFSEGTTTVTTGDGRTYTVTRTEEVPDGVSVTLPPDFKTTLNVTIGLATAESLISSGVVIVDTIREIPGFSFGSSGETVIDMAITEDGAPLTGGSYEVCLPVPDEFKGFQTSRLVLLHYDDALERWDELSMPSVEDGTICAATPSFSLFGVAVSNQGPDVAKALEPLVLQLNDAATTITLNDYFHDPNGDVLTYEAEATNTNLVTVQIDKDQLILTPVARGQTEVTVTAGESHGQSSKKATQTFSVSVRASTGVSERFRQLNEEILSKHALSLAATTNQTITGRLETGLGAGTQERRLTIGAQSTLTEVVRTTGQDLGGDGLALARLLGTSSFVLPLAGLDRGVPAITLWGSGDYRNLEGGEANALNWAGDVVTGQLGADARLRPDLLAGAVLSWSRGAFDYTDRNNDGSEVAGDYTSQFTSVHPYMGWTPQEGIRLWATGGFGWGEIEITEDDEAPSSDSRLQMASVGGSGRLLSEDGLFTSGTTTLRLKGEASVARVRVAGDGNLLERMTVKAQRLRVLVEGTHQQALASGGQVTPSLEVGLRHDGGDGATGTGVELGGGLRYEEPAWGLTLEGRARVLAAYEGAYEEWGASGLVRLDPGADGQGLAFSLVPAYGQSTSGVNQLWEQGLTQGSGLAQAQRGRLDAEVAYGLPVLEHRGLVTPYSGVTLGGGSQEVRIGGRWALGPALKLSLEGKRQVRDRTLPAYGLWLQTEWQF